MVIRRVITGIAIGLVLGFVMWIGEPWFTLAACLLAAAAAFEFYRIVKNENVRPMTYFGVVLSILMVLNGHSPYSFTFPLLVVLATVIPLIWMVFRNSQDNSFISWGWTLAGLFYTGGLMTYYVLIRSLPNGAGWVFMVAACTAMCDVFAYAVGSRLGKHHVATSISPHKTWEGCAGGMLASIVFAVGFGIGFKLPLSIWQMIAAGVVIGLFAEIGDLVESLLKRNMKAKDAGNILPGHGGILDRIDSHLLVAPVAYYLIILSDKLGWLSGSF
jgi:phosphatidate cytidylyltransferase